METGKVGLGPKNKEQKGGLAVKHLLKADLICMNIIEHAGKEQKKQKK